MAQKVESKGHKYALISEELYKNLRKANQKTDLTESPEFLKMRNLDEEISQILENKYLPDSMKAQMYSQAVAAFGEFRQRAPETRKEKEKETISVSQVKTEPMEPEIQPTLPQAVKAEATEHKDKPTPSQTVKIIKEKETEPSIKQEEKVSIKEDSPPAEIDDTGDEEDVFEDAPSPSPFAVLKPSQETRMKALERARKNDILEAMKGKESIVSYNPKNRNLIIRGYENPSWNFASILDYVVKNRPPKDKPPGVAHFLEALGYAGVSKELIRNKTLQQHVEAAAMSGKGRIRKWTKLY